MSGTAERGSGTFLQTCFERKRRFIRFFDSIDVGRGIGYTLRT